MAKVSPFVAFRLEDFPSEQKWIAKLFQPLNLALGQVVQALNGQVTFGDNIPTFSKLLSGSNLRLPLSFQITNKVIPTQMNVSQASKDGVPITMIGAWSISGDTITINELFQVSASGNSALETGAKYSIVLRFT